MSKKRIIFATGNAGKVREIKDIVGHMGIEVLTMREAGVEAEPEENGSSFEENALIKAGCVAALVRKAEEEGRMDGPGQGTVNIVMSDDSGLVVDALDGAPGVYSARYGGEGLDDDGRWKLLLKNMEGKEDRACRFVCVICCALPDGSEVMSRGTVEGQVALGPEGDGGLGYDPIFYLPDRGCTMACLPAEEKNAISHRGNALRAFQEEWEKRYGTDQ